MVEKLDRLRERRKMQKTLKKLLNYYVTYKLVNNLMRKGKKDKAIKILNKVIVKLSVNLNKSPLRTLTSVVRTISPPFRLKKKRIAGKNFSIPLFIPVKKQINYGAKYLVKNSRERKGNGIVLALFSEIVDTKNGNTNSISLKKKKELCRIAIENKYYIKYL